MDVTLRLERTMRRAFLDRKQPWQINLDGTHIRDIMQGDVLELAIEPGHHTLQLTSTGKRSSPVREFEAKSESMVEFACHTQPIWPLMLMALVVPGRWIALKKR